MLSIPIVIIETNLSKERPSAIIVWGVSNIQQRMLGGCFKGYIAYKYESYDVAKHKFKYTHCDLTYQIGYMTMTLIIGSYFATTFFPCLNVGCLICIINLGIIFQFEGGD
jgi:hypothetical protein